MSIGIDELKYKQRRKTKFAPGSEGGFYIQHQLHKVERLHRGQIAPDTMMKKETAHHVDVCTCIGFGDLRVCKRKKPIGVIRDFERQGRRDDRGSI